MPATDFCCTGDCDITATGLLGTPDSKHWATVQGAVTISTAIARNGGRSIRFNSAAADQYLAPKTTPSTTRRFWRGYLYFATLPNTDTVILRMITTAGASPQLLFRQATSDIIAMIGVGGAGATPFVVTTGVFYLIDFEGDVSGGTRTAKLTVDGVDKLTSSSAVAASDSTSWRIGNSCTGVAVTADLYWDDIITGSGAGYPFGPGQGIGVLLTSDGVHSYNAAGDFKYNDSSNIALAATDTWSYLVHRLNSISSFLACGPALSAAEYLEWNFGNMPAAGVINAVECVSAHHTSSTPTNKQTLRLNDGGTVVDVFTDADFSGVTLFYHSKHYATKPSGGAWTQAALNALKARWGSSWTAVDLVPPPYIDGIVLEVDYVASAAINFTPGSQRISYAVVAGLSGFARAVQLQGADRVQLGVRLHVPTFSVVNPSTAPPPADASFTAEGIIEAARDRHASFDKQRHPAPILLRFLDRLQRRLVGEALVRDLGFMSQTHDVVFPLSDFTVGYALPFVYHLLAGGDIYGQANVPLGEFHLLPWGHRFDPGPLYSGWVMGTQLYFRGSAADWTPVSKVTLSYVPTVSTLSALSAAVALPRSAEDAMVEHVASFMAARGHKDPQVPDIDVGSFMGRAAAAEAMWLNQIGGRRRTQTKQVREVW